MTSQSQACLILAVMFGATHGDPILLVTTTSTTTRYYKELVESLPSQQGRCVAITGTTSGLGYSAAIAAAQKDPACLLLLNRASDRAVKAEEDAKKAASAGVVVKTITCDLSNISSVRDAAANVNSFVKKFGGLDVLALNAGIMDMPDVRTIDGYDLTMQTNHLSHFLLTKLVMPSLREAAAKRGEVRIVTHSSLARGGPPVNATVYAKSPAGTLGGDADAAGMERYHQSKLANFVFAMALNKKFREAPEYSSFKALSAAPGISMTELKVPDSWKGKLPEFVQKFLQDHILLSAPDGSCSLLTSMFAESAKSGDFF